MAKDIISPNYLKRLHPELSKRESHLYHRFCRENNIITKTEYKENKTIYQLWKESKINGNS